MDNTHRPRPRRPMEAESQQGTDRELFEDTVLHALENLNEKIMDIESVFGMSRFGGGQRMNRGGYQGRPFMGGDEYMGRDRAAGFNDDYRYENFNGGYRGSQRMPNDAEERLARIRDIAMMHEVPSYGPRSGYGPRGERAFSGSREGLRNELGVAVTRDGDIDERTREGRALRGDEEFTNEQLEGFMADPSLRSADGTFDLRTTEGRALLAAGWIDDNGRENDAAWEEELEDMTQTSQKETTRSGSSTRGRGRKGNNT